MLVWGQEDEDENIEDNDEFQEGKLRFAGGRGEKATYDAGDDEDKEIEAAARKEAAVKEGDLDQVDTTPSVTCKFLLRSTPTHTPPFQLPTLPVDAWL